jgi:phosphoribosylformylglycinamidine synthase
MTTSVHVALGLTDDEYDAIVSILGREPNHLELAMYSVMWSEHCSYKSSRIHLRRFPTTGEHVIMGPGENAGVIDAGDDFAVAIRMESHNHPSAIEPYQGAATGVGGILRDIFTVGARPVALLDSLWMGPRCDSRSQWIYRGVVQGISGYGNAVGVPTVGGEIAFRTTFKGNPLVNVAAIGVAPKSRLVRATASGIGNAVVLLGSSTGRDGIGGVSVLASAGFDSSEEDTKRPSVQVGDPFEEKKLIEACLELLDRSLVSGIQDLGGAGLSCATSETAANGKVGMNVYLDQVPLRELAMEPFEIMTSESQERMLAIVPPQHLEEVLKIASKWEVQASKIGEVVPPQDFRGRQVGMLNIYDHEHGVVLASVPTASLADEAPLYDRPVREPASFASAQQADVVWSLTDEEAVRFVKSTQFDPVEIYRQYDHQLFLNTLIGPGADAALLRVAAPGTGSANVAMALSADGNPRWCAIDPYWGSVATVVESALNVACVGAEPKAIVDCLNFGNPTHPEVMWQLTRSIEGISVACEALGIPVVGGNVSLYNESDGTDIEPTPALTTIGFRPLPEPGELTQVPEPGNHVIEIGPLASTLAGSVMAVDAMGNRTGALFQPDLGLVRELTKLVAALCREHRFGVRAAHNVSSGGRLQALMDMIRRFRVGLVIDDSSSDPVSVFGEEPTRVIVVTDAPEAVIEAVEAVGLPYRRVGVIAEHGRVEGPWISAMYT